MKIRKAGIDDLETLQRFNQELCLKENMEFDKTIDTEYSSTDSAIRYYKKSIENDSYISLIAEEEGVPIGYLIGVIYKSEGYRNILDLGEVQNMYVQEDLRGKGIGSALMNYFKDWCREREVERIRVIASFDNKETIEFYKKVGFNEYDLVLEGDLK